MKYQKRLGCDSAFRPLGSSGTWSGHLSLRLTKPKWDRLGTKSEGNGNEREKMEKKEKRNLFAGRDVL